MPEDRAQTFSEFLVRESSRIDLATVAINLVIAIVLASLLGWLYVRFGRSASDRRAFAAQFVLITATTTIVIVVVKSSLALSLGLVGALSIVRFRSAVREHEELAFLFLAIALGLCMGADQVELALLGFALVAAFLVLRGTLGRAIRHENLFLRVHGSPSVEDPVRVIAEVLSRFCTMVKLKRADISEDLVEATFQVEFRSFEDLTRAQEDLSAAVAPMAISVIDGEGIA